MAGSSAQFATFSSDGYALSVNVPSDTASSGSGPIYLQISAQSGTEWISFGQGTRMAGSNMLVVYAADSTNVTVSPRLGTGHVEPRVNSDASIVVLEGTGITSDGTIVANIRCDSCLNWSGGSMVPTDTASSWIFAHRSGDALDSTSTDASISQHDSTGRFTLDLTTGTGGSSSNPFVAASDDSSSASGSASQTAPATATELSGTPTSAATTATNGVSNPLASSNPSSSGSSEVGTDSDDENIRTAHAVIMPLVFVVLFPLGALTVYLPYHQKVRHIHAPLQVISLILMIVGLGLGVKLGKQVDNLDGYHMVIGYIVVAWMVLFQPALGLVQHLHFRRAGTRSPMGLVHQWIGRAIILLGVINGGLGFMTTGPLGSNSVPTSAVVVYSVFTGVIFLVYMAVVLFASFSPKQSPGGLPGEKPRPTAEGYEMHGRSFEDPRPQRF